MTTKKQIIGIDIPLDLIQSLRLAHALMESKHNVYINKKDKEKFEFLQRYFDISFFVKTKEIKSLPNLKINHTKPETRVGSISRPLVFPHAILDRCRELWSNEREVKVFFTGLVTEQRRKSLNRWLKASGLKGNVSKYNLIMQRFTNSYIRNFRMFNKHNLFKGNDPIIINSSNNGRKYPEKCWDEEYYNLLSSSKFCLCPSGDFVWTYRFFEAAMCGSIPIVEENCQSYEGFIYYNWNDRLSDFSWSTEVAEHNFLLCKNKLTINLEDIDKEISKLLDA